MRYLFRFEAEHLSLARLQARGLYADYEKRPYGSSYLVT
jgi:hypothetical protein